MASLRRHKHRHFQSNPLLRHIMDGEVMIHVR
jgi:hypothetical protein